MQEGLVITPFDYEDLPPPASSLQGGTFLVNVSFRVLLRGGDDALGTLDFLLSSNTLLILFCFDLVSKLSCLKKKSFRWSLSISPSLSLSAYAIFFNSREECHNLSPVIGSIETIPSLCSLVDLISFLHFFFSSFLSSSEGALLCRLPSLWIL